MKCLEALAFDLHLGLALACDFAANAAILPALVEVDGAEPYALQQGAQALDRLSQDIPVKWSGLRQTAR
ncbi:MAG: hypothetical protein M5R42_16155 [Rhodocyclaceae bacterium]|nr:hypothetical protein [Rhodocyclaceae bacterium]